MHAVDWIILAAVLTPWALPVLAATMTVVVLVVALALWALL